jgi:hypothetical protein
LREIVEMNDMQRTMIRNLTTQPDFEIEYGEIIEFLNNFEYMCEEYRRIAFSPENYNSINLESIDILLHEAYELAHEIHVLLHQRRLIFQ